MTPSLITEKCLAYRLERAPIHSAPLPSMQTTERGMPARVCVCVCARARARVGVCTCALVSVSPSVCCCSPPGWHWPYCCMLCLCEICICGVLWSNKWWSNRCFNNE